MELQQQQQQQQARFLLQPIEYQLPQVSNENVLNPMETDEEMDTDNGHEVEIYEQEVKFTVTYLDGDEEEAETVLPDDFNCFQ